MSHKNYLELLEFDINATTDELNKRVHMSEIINGRVNNNDIVNMVSQTVRKKTAPRRKVAKVIQKTDTKLLKEPLEESIHATDQNEIKSEKVMELSTAMENVSTASLNKGRPSLMRIANLIIDNQTRKQTDKLKYRESVFRAASKVSSDMVLFPPWCYKNRRALNTRKINVGGRIFEIFEETWLNLKNTKLNTCINDHKMDDMIFIDRDPVCFNAILNFYRTGKLHQPPNVCLAFFEEELCFWGINEIFMNSCCWSDYQTFKNAGNKLKKYSEDKDRNQTFSDNKNRLNFKIRRTVYRIMMSQSTGKISQWNSLLCAASIIVGILCMIIETTPIGRKDKNSNKISYFEPNESVTHFLHRTRMNWNVIAIEMFISGYFCFDLLSRMILCPNKLEFFCDALNWVDIIATLTSIVGVTPIMELDSGHLETYILFLKLPRILRLFRLTESLRSGIGAFTLTIKACVKELVLVFVILTVSTVIFGILEFAVEIAGSNPNIKNIYVSMWFAIASMSGVGFGDYYPLTLRGYLVGSMCIISGVVVCQMPVPIFLKNFSIYYNQASGRLISQSQMLLFENVDRSDVRNFEMEYLDNMDLKNKSKVDKKNDLIGKLRNKFKR